MIIKDLQILSRGLNEVVKIELKVFSPISVITEELSKFDFAKLNKRSLEEIKLYVKKIEDFFDKQTFSSGKGYVYTPPPQFSANRDTVDQLVKIVDDLDLMDSKELRNEVKKSKIRPDKSKTSSSLKQGIFVGHGRSKLWSRVQLYLKDEHGLNSFSFESESHASESIVQVLEGFLDRSSFAILILTAEDETSEGRLRARQNVIHELGLFQGKLGFDKVVLLKQDKVEEFSNLAGLQYIPFSGENVEQTFYELGRKMKKSKVIK